MQAMADSEGTRMEKLRDLKDADKYLIQDKPYRSIVKAISWRVTGTLDTIVISLIVTGKLKLALSIGLVECFTKIAWYYLHERVWNRISLGRIKLQTHEYDI